MWWPHGLQQRQTVVCLLRNSSGKVLLHTKTHYRVRLAPMRSYACPSPLQWSWDALASLSWPGSLACPWSCGGIHSTQDHMEGSRGRFSSRKIRYFQQKKESGRAGKNNRCLPNSFAANDSQRSSSKFHPANMEGAELPG